MGCLVEVGVFEMRLVLTWRRGFGNQRSAYIHLELAMTTAVHLGVRSDPCVYAVILQLDRPLRRQAVLPSELAD